MVIEYKFFNSMTELNEKIGILETDYKVNLQIINVQASPGGFYLFYTVK